MLTKKWTGDLVGLMHNHKISKTELANELGITREYVSMILNEHRDPAGARERFEGAVNRLIDQKQNEPG